MGERAWPVRMGPIVAAVVVAAAGAAVVVAVVADDDEASPTADPVEGFIAAYERSRTSTFVVEQSFTRTAPDGRSFTEDQRIVQRPPDDRVVVGAGTAEGRVGGNVVRCATTPGAGARCDEGPPADPYDEEVASEAATLRSLVDGPDAPYLVVEGDPGCWELTLDVEVPSPPYGERAVFCFDDATGAPTLLEIQRPEATDVIEAVTITATVTDADLRLTDLG